VSGTRIAKSGSSATLIHSSLPWRMNLENPFRIFEVGEILRIIVQWVREIYNFIRLLMQSLQNARPRFTLAVRVLG
jgi:hypothetical protein